MHAELATLPALLCTSASPLTRFGQHDSPAMWRGLRSSHMLLSGHHQSRASMSSAAQPGWPRRSQSTGLTAPVDYMSSSAVSHIAFLSRLLAGRHLTARLQDSNNLNGCRYRTILCRENDRRWRTQLHCFVACRRLLLRAL